MAYTDDGLNTDMELWQGRVSLELSLLQALSLHGLVLLALRHPGTFDTQAARATGEETAALLTRLLLHTGAMTEAALRACFAVEGEAQGMTWTDLQAAGARLDARNAAAGRVNPDERRIPRADTR